MFHRFIQCLQAHRTTILRTLFVIWGIALLMSCIYYNLNYLASNNYSSWGLSDWLINYEGGFVRRGIVGQVLLESWRVAPFPPYVPIHVGILSSLLVLVYLTFRLFKREGWSYLLLLSSLFVIPSFACDNLIWTRKDYLLILLVCAVFYCYCQYIRERKTSGLVGMQLFGVIVILMHEASFFFMMPILMLHRFQTLENDKNKRLKRITKTFLFFLPILTAEAACCLFKGDKTIAMIIWESWRPAMEMYPMATASTEVGCSIKALGWSTVNTFRIHLTTNFLKPVMSGLPTCSSLPFTVYLFFAAYYLVTRMNTTDLKLHPLRPVRHSALSNVLLIQFISMLPMFTLLSCDYGRTIPYWIVSTLFFYSLFKTDEGFIPDRLNHISVKMQAFIDRRPLLNNPWFYFFVALSLPTTQVSGVSLYNTQLFHIAVAVLHFFDPLLAL